MNDKENKYMTRMTQIVKSNSNVHKGFYSKQQSRIKELKKIRNAQLHGQKVDISPVFEDLKLSGIIDENGHISKQYKNKD